MVSKRTQGLLVNVFVALGVLVLLHVFFVAVPSHLAERSGSEPRLFAPAADPEPGPALASDPVHGPSGVSPGILASPDRN